jgi:hypothetical protein
MSRLEQLMLPAEPRAILVELAKLRLHYSHLNLTQKELEILLGDYVNDLMPYPIDLIRAACISYRRDPKHLFFPKIGQLLQLIIDPCHMRKWQLDKMKKLLLVSNGRKS